MIQVLNEDISVKYIKVSNSSIPKRFYQPLENLELKLKPSPVFDDNLFKEFYLLTKVLKDYI